MSHMYYRTLIVFMFTLIGLSACGGGGGSNASTTDASPVDVIADAAEDSLFPSIHDPLPQLGKKLFFSKSLSGDMDTACASCHHPVLGGGDNLSLPIGVDADKPEQLGTGRSNSGDTTPVPRNAPTTFNTALWNRGLFLDSRVEALNPQPDQNGASGGIRTPDSAFGVIDNNAGENLAAAQARFPVTSVDEMLASSFENGSSNSVIRDHLAARIGNYGVGAGELATNNWLSEFQTAFASSESAETLVTFNNIAKAIGEYERSQVFINNPWKAFREGDEDAISEAAKAGANLFFGAANTGGAGCINCHTGNLLSDERFHVVAFPQIGPGKGDGPTSDDDFGRSRETNNSNDLYRFRTTSLLNIEVTGPYTHSGAYDNLEDVVRHYNNPQSSVDDYFNNNEWCLLSQFSGLANCTSLFSNGKANTQKALDQLALERLAGTSRLPVINLNNTEISQIVEFLKTLTDPCVKDRSCLADWIPDTSDTGPDGQQLNAVDTGDNLL